MSIPQSLADLAASAQLADAPEAFAKPNIRQDIEDRNFGLPNALHAGFFGLFLAYLGVMGLGFPHPEMILPMAIFFIFTVGFYVVPMAWAVMKPVHADRAMDLPALLDRGIAIHTGRSSGRDAAVQVLILPVLILGWGIAVVSIAALA